MPFQKGHKLGFKKGQSGNAGGKPKAVTGLVETCREFCNTYGVQALVDIAKDTTDRKLQLAALIYITNRGFGCPTDKLAVEGKITLEQIIAAAHKPKE